MLPVITLALPVAAYVARLMRNSMQEVLRANFIRTARAKGVERARRVPAPRVAAGADSRGQLSRAGRRVRDHRLAGGRIGVRAAGLGPIPGPGRHRPRLSTGHGHDPRLRRAHAASAISSRTCCTAGSIRACGSHERAAPASRSSCSACWPRSRCSRPGSRPTATTSLDWQHLAVAAAARRLRTGSAPIGSGRDLFARSMQAMRVSLLIGVLAALVSVVHRRRLGRDRRLSRRPHRRGHDAFRRHRLRAAVRLHRDHPVDDVRARQHRGVVHRHRRRGLAHHGAHRARPDAEPAPARIHRCRHRERRRARRRSCGGTSCPTSPAR